jgi:hypothetical protein
LPTNPFSPTCLAYGLVRLTSPFGPAFGKSCFFKH